MSRPEVLNATVLDHLIAADYVLEQVAHLTSGRGVPGIHPQDLHEWVQQLHDRLNAINT